MSRGETLPSQQPVHQTSNLDSHPMHTPLSERFLVKIALALLSAALLICSLPAPNLGWLAWIALVPLIIACQGITPSRAAGLGFLSGMAANFGIYRWSLEVPAFGTHHFLILSTFFALYPAVWCTGISLLGRDRLGLTIGTPALWVVLDYVRAHAGFLAFPWGTLAHTQHQNLVVLQVATLAGEYGVTFLVVLGNAAVAGVIIRRAWRSAVVPGLVLALVHIGGAFALLAERPGPAIRVAVVQPSILVGEQTTAAGRATSFNRLAGLTRVAAASRPALIAWPEMAVIGQFRSNPFLMVDLVDLAREVRTPLVFGVAEVEKFASVNAQGNMRRRAYNAAYVVTPEALLGAPYVKRVLLPFAEYVPLHSVIGWPAWLVPHMINMVPGDKPRVFALQDGTLFAPLISWESLFEGLARESVRMGARLLVQLNNNTWFGRTAAAQQQNISSVLRAVENRVPVVLSSNTGPSQIIDSYGRIVARTAGIFTAGFAAGDVKLNSGGTLYTQVGDLFVFITIGALVLGVLRWLLACK